MAETSICTGCDSCKEVLNLYNSNPGLRGIFSLSSGRVDKFDSLLNFPEGRPEACIKDAPFNMSYSQLKVGSSAGKNISYYGICLLSGCNISSLQGTLNSEIFK